jgi:site-specific DNA-cytosine methylase
MTLRFVEFFSGIGAFHEASRGVAEVVAAFDQSEAANATYRLNFGLAPGSKNIASLSWADLHPLKARGWHLSPPCQPFSHKGRQSDLDDPRSAALVRLLDLLEEQVPDVLVLENVPPFGESRARARLTSILARHGLFVREQVICPTLLGIPNRRARYYLCASRLPFPTDEVAHIAEVADLGPGQGECSPRPSRGSAGRLTPGYVRFAPAGGSRSPIVSRPAHLRPSSFAEAWEDKSTIALLDAHPGEDLYLDPSQLSEYRHVLDIRQPGDVLACFGASYGHARSRAGSYLATEEGVRRFSPEEVVRILGFPRTFRFPENLSRQICWRLAGNSMSVPAIRHVLSWIDFPGYSK